MSTPVEPPCELCQRRGTRLTKHHLIPKQRAGQHGPTAELCEACHKQIHTLYDNRRLARELNTLERLGAQPEMERFVRWVRKQDPSRNLRVRLANHRRRGS